LVDKARATGEVAALRCLLNREQSEPLQVAVAKTLIEWDAPGPFARSALERWPEVSKAARRQMIVSSLKGSNAPLALLDFVEPGLIAKVEIDPATRQALQKHRDPTVAARAKVIFADAISLDRETTVNKYRAALKLDGDRKHGAELFERTCVVCHQMQGVGARIGPDLSGIGQHARETLLVDILDPSRQVLPDFVSYTATTKSGDTFTGFIANESVTTVTLRRANEPDATLIRAELKDFRTESKSVMPDGLEAGMNEQDVADLIEFLRRPDRTLFTQAK
jgi:putative heme-binding domain-containing protein